MSHSIQIYILTDDNTYSILIRGLILLTIGYTNTNRGKNTIQNKKKTMLSAMIVISAITIIIGFYVGFILKDIILLAAVLVVIELFVALIVEITGVFKDTLNNKEKELAKLLGIQKLKRCNTYRINR